MTSPGLIWELACNRDPASVGTNYLDLWPVRAFMQDPASRPAQSFAVLAWQIQKQIINYVVSVRLMLLNLCLNVTIVFAVFSRSL